MINLWYEIKFIWEARVSSFTVHGFLIALSPSHAAVITPSVIFFCGKLLPLLISRGLLQIVHFCKSIGIWRALRRYRSTVLYFKSIQVFLWSGRLYTIFTWKIRRWHQWLLLLEGQILCRFMILYWVSRLVSRECWPWWDFMYCNECVFLWLLLCYRWLIISLLGGYILGYH